MHYGSFSEIAKLQRVSALIVNCFSRWKGVVKLTVSFILIIILLNNFGNLFSSPWRINVVKVFNDYKFPGYFNTYHAFGLSSIYSLWKHQKTWGFLVFSGVIEIYLLHDMVRLSLKKSSLRSAEDLLKIYWNLTKEIADGLNNWNQFTFKNFIDQWFFLKLLIRVLFRTLSAMD